MADENEQDRAASGATAAEGGEKVHDFARLRSSQRVTADVSSWVAQMREQFQPLVEDVQRQLRLQRPILSDLARAVGEQQNKLLRLRLPKIELPDVSALAKLGKAWRESLPGNWHDLPISDFDKLTATANMTGWSLTWVPRREVLSDLLSAADVTAAERILLDHADDVLADIRAVLPAVQSPILVDQRDAVLQGVDAYDAGAPHPAQAMAATVITTVIEQHFGHSLGTARQKWDGLDPDEEPLLSYRRSLLLRSLGGALQNFRGNDPVPNRFNRHATVHRFDLKQYRTVNALAGLMLATSLLRELHQDATS